MLQCIAVCCSMLCIPDDRKPFSKVSATLTFHNQLSNKVVFRISLQNFGCNWFPKLCFRILGVIGRKGQPQIESHPPRNSQESTSY